MFLGRVVTLRVSSITLDPYHWPLQWLVIYELLFFYFFHFFILFFIIFFEWMNSLLLQIYILPEYGFTRFLIGWSCITIIYSNNIQTLQWVMIWLHVTLHISWIYYDFTIFFCEFTMNLLFVLWIYFKFSRFSRIYFGITIFYTDSL